MEENNDLLSMLEEPETIKNVITIENKIDLLDEDKNEPEEVRTSSKILEEYTKLDLEKSKVELEIEKLKEKYPEVFLLLEKHNQSIQEILNQENSLKEELTESMKNEGLTKLAGNKFQATYVAETVRTTFDRKSFETKYPVLCKQFLKSSPVSAYIKISEVKK